VERASTTVVETEGALSITVRDDGVGFAPADDTPGFGLIGMRERVALVGGRVEVDSAPGSGTTISATVPARRAGRGTGAVATPLSG
jgi:signal transduction histidine kinase